MNLKRISKSELINISKLDPLSIPDWNNELRDLWKDYNEQRKKAGVYF